MSRRMWVLIRSTCFHAFSSRSRSVSVTPTTKLHDAGDCFRRNDLALLQAGGKSPKSFQPPCFPGLSALGLCQASCEAEVAKIEPGNVICETNNWWGGSGCPRAVRTTANSTSFVPLIPFEQDGGEAEIALRRSRRRMT